MTPSQGRELAERYVATADAALRRAFEEYIAEIVASDAGTFAQLPEDVAWIAMEYWWKVSAAMARKDEEYLESFLASGAEPPPMDVALEAEVVQRIDALAALYCLGEMGSR